MLSELGSRLLEGLINEGMVIMVINGFRHKFEVVQHLFSRSVGSPRSTTDSASGTKHQTTLTTKTSSTMQ